MRRFIGPLVGVLLVWGGNALFAGQGEEAPAVEEDYVLAPGDTIQIFIYNEEQQPPPLKINPKGNVMVPLIGSPVKVAGLTTGEAKKLLEEKLKRVHKFPEVTVNLLEQGLRGDHIYVFGAFQKLGRLPHEAGMRMLDVLAGAGGVASDADLAHASITRGSKTLAVDLQQLFEGDLSQDLEIEADDIIRVPRGEFYVLGAVKTPGRFPITPETRVLEAIIAAGGYTEEAALREAVLFRRDGQNVPVDLWSLLKQGNILNNVPLRSGDILFLPEGELTAGIMVFGEVSQPGRYPYEPGESLIEALQKSNLRSGGATATGEAVGTEVNEVTLLRANEEPRVIDLKRLLKDGDLSLNVPLQPGDVLIVRQRRHKVTLLGRVSRMGTYLVPTVATLLDVLPQAGELSVDADLRRVSILRGEERLVRDLRALIYEGQMDQNLDLQDGDIILIPEIDPAGEILVLGDVKEPGPHVKRENEKLMQALAIAGGVPELGRYEAQITRGENQLLHADLWSLLREGNVSQNLPLEQGDVIVVREKPEEVFVVGLVQRPGMYRLRERTCLPEVLGEAGGPVSEKANLREVRIIRGEEVLKADLMALYTGGDLGPLTSWNIPLQADDVIVVPQIDPAGEIIVLGLVNKPGPHVMQEDERLLTALALAEGVGARTEAGLRSAVEGHLTAQVTRGEEILQADLRLLYEEGDLRQNLELQRGDVIVVRSIPEEITIFGAMERPGTYALRPRERLLDGLATAGGVQERADLSHVVLLRGEERQVIDLERMLKGEAVTPEDVAQNVALQAGDVLVVPRLGEEAEVVVVGEVTQPGIYPYREEMRVLSALALAQGFQAQADMEQTTIIRGEERLTLDLNKFLKEGDKTQNVPLKAGDVVLVPELKEANVLVFGQVEKPGAYPPVEGMTLADVLSTAGLTPKADLNRVSIFRGDQLIAVDYQALVEKGEVSQNPELQRGDRILVPERERFYLFGAVVQPGMYPVSKKDFRLAEVIGFMDPAADLSHVRIIRPDPQGAEPVSLQANLTRFMKTADQSQNMVIQPGDFIYVPPKGKKEPWYKQIFNYNTVWSLVTSLDYLDRKNIF